MVLLLTITNISVAQNSPNWKTWKSNNTLAVSYKRIPSSPLYLIKASAEINSTLSGFLLFLQDTKNIPNWLENANKSYIVQQRSPVENIFVTEFNGIWPVTARNMVLHTKYKQNDDLSIDISVMDAANEVPEIEKSIRMSVLSAHWHITALSPEKIKISYSIHVDPNGSIPQWLTNKLALKSMWQTLKNMQQQIPNSPFQSQHLKHIIEMK
jgi:hypothetical protein